MSEPDQQWLEADIDIPSGIKDGDILYVKFGGQPVRYRAHKIGYGSFRLDPVEEPSDQPEGV